MIYFLPNLKQKIRQKTELSTGKIHKIKNPTKCRISHFFKLGFLLLKTENIFQIFIHPNSLRSWHEFE